MKLQAVKWSIGLWRISNSHLCLAFWLQPLVELTLACGCELSATLSGYTVREGQAVISLLGSMPTRDSPIAGVNCPVLHADMYAAGYVGTLLTEVRELFTCLVTQALDVNVGAVINLGIEIGESDNIMNICQT